MIPEKMLELLLLQKAVTHQLHVPDTGEYDKRKMLKRYKELKNEFLGQYLKDSNT